ncbi:MAG TPA: isoprenylcysteine carboxylmethyltransferase family protein [Pseudohaliea sp.]|nr:isoprenylcysteine carboxylmethyltransferase family protein [Pseudohaliea sp.]
MSERRVIYPPLWLVFGVVAIFAVDVFLPGPRFAGAAAQFLGGALLVAGLALLVVAGGLFTRADTGMIPFRDTRALVTHGLYRYSRNPMYLAMALVLLGVAVTVGASMALPVPLAFLVIIERRFIRAEERQLEALFGEEYLAYCRRVRRWL